MQKEEHATQKLKMCEQDVGNEARCRPLNNAMLLLKIGRDGKATKLRTRYSTTLASTATTSMNRIYFAKVGHHKRIIIFKFCKSGYQVP